LSDDPEVFYFLGMAHFQRKAKAEAIVALEKCLSLAPDGPLSAEAKKTLELAKK
jgi:cytochrome c-type biogenesis protein CcmH/NrfG